MVTTRRGTSTEPQHAPPSSTTKPRRQWRRGPSTRRPGTTAITEEPPAASHHSKRAGSPPAVDPPGSKRARAAPPRVEAIAEEEPQANDDLAAAPPDQGAPETSREEIWGKIPFPDHGFLPQEDNLVPIFPPFDPDVLLDEPFPPPMDEAGTRDDDVMDDAEDQRQREAVASKGSRSFSSLGRTLTVTEQEEMRRTWNAAQRNADEEQQFQQAELDPLSEGEEQPHAEVAPTFTASAVEGASAGEKRRLPPKSSGKGKGKGKAKHRSPSVASASGGGVAPVGDGEGTSSPIRNNSHIRLMNDMRMHTHLRSVQSIRRGRRLSRSPSSTSAESHQRDPEKPNYHPFRALFRLPIGETLAARYGRLGSSEAPRSGASEAVRAIGEGGSGRKKRKQKPEGMSSFEFALRGDEKVDPFKGFLDGVTSGEEWSDDNSDGESVDIGARLKKKEKAGGKGKGKKREVPVVNDPKNWQMKGMPAVVVMDVAVDRATGGGWLSKAQQEKQDFVESPCTAMFQKINSAETNGSFVQGPRHPSVIMYEILRSHLKAHLGLSLDNLQQPGSYETQLLREGRQVLATAMANGGPSAAQKLQAASLLCCFEDLVKTSYQILKRDVTLENEAQRQDGAPAVKPRFDGVDQPFRPITDDLVTELERGRSKTRDPTTEAVRRLDDEQFDDEEGLGDPLSDEGGMTEVVGGKMSWKPGFGGIQLGKGKLGAPVAGPSGTAAAGTSARAIAPSNPVLPPVGAEASKEGGVAQPFPPTGGSGGPPPPGQVAPRLRSSILDARLQAGAATSPDLAGLFSWGDDEQRGSEGGREQDGDADNDELLPLSGYRFGGPSMTAGASGLGRSAADEARRATMLQEIAPEELLPL